MLGDYSSFFYYYISYSAFINISHHNIIIYIIVFRHSLDIPTYYYFLVYKLVHHKILKKKLFVITILIWQKIVYARI